MTPIEVRLHYTRHSDTVQAGRRWLDAGVRRHDASEWGTACCAPTALSVLRSVFCLLSSVSFLLSLRAFDTMSRLR